ncbi:hypothetical protein ACFRAE_12540 [Sphingobacterium sp. HJSM2_6]|uniref:hypothetical protein n=1 Tax=Sphingobacterium sp. HJSM2_6 TaxID=3366264 RepID=UPI003BED750F
MTLNLKLLITGLLLIAVSIQTTQAQLDFSVYSNTYIGLTSYLGKETTDDFNSFQFNMNGQNINYSNWSLSARVIGSISPVSGGPNVSHTDFPANKISMRLTNAFSRQSNVSFSLDGIAASRGIFTLSNAEVFLIQNAQQPLQSAQNYYVQNIIQSKFQVEEGLYLNDFLSSDSYQAIVYKISILYSLYHSSGQLIKSFTKDYDFQIARNLTDGHLVGVAPDYQISIMPAAQQVTMQFQDAENYRNGISMQLNDAVSVHAMTDYEIKVKSVEAEFNKTSGGTLPLSILKIQLVPSTSALGNFNPQITLANNEQTLVRGTSSNKNIERKYTLAYWAKLGANEINTASTGTYSVSLMYILLPQ